MLRLIALFIVAAFTIASVPPPAIAASDPVLSLSAAKKKQRHVRSRHVVRDGQFVRGGQAFGSGQAFGGQQVGGGQIACTVNGCQPISRRCTPTTEFDFWGNPTGYDAVACR
jgi:hypothetical protein